MLSIRLFLGIVIVFCCILAFLFLRDGEVFRPIVLLVCASLLSWVSLQEYLDDHR